MLPRLFVEYIPKCIIIFCGCIVFLSKKVHKICSYVNVMKDMGTVHNKENGYTNSVEANDNSLSIGEWVPPTGTPVVGT